MTLLPTPRPTRAVFTAVGVLLVLSPAPWAVAQEKPTVPTATPPSAATGSAFTRGLDAYRKGDLDTARDLLTQAVKAEPNNGEAESVLGYLLVKSGDAAVALPHLERAVVLRPAVADAYINLGNALLLLPRRTAADTDRAQQLFGKAATLAPDSVEAQMSLGYASTRTGHFAAAVAAYRKAAALRPKDGKAWTNLGLALRSLKRTDEAADALQKATVYAPQDAASWAALGEVAMEKGDTTAAINALETARKLDGQNFPVALDLAQVYVATSRFGEAAEAYSAAATLTEAMGKPDAALRYNQGVSLGKVGRVGESGAAYELALAIEPRSYDALLNSGFVFFQQNKFVEAAQRFRTATQVRPNAALGWKNRAAADTRLKDWTGAVGDWKRVVALEPKNYPAREALAAALLQAGQMSEAAAVYQQMASLRPDSAEPLIARGIIFQREAETEPTAARKQALLVSAMQSFEAAVKRDPKSGPAYNNLGVVHERRGEIPEALAAYQKAAAVDPTLTDARRNVARFQTPGLPTIPAPAETGKKP